MNNSQYHHENLPEKLIEAGIKLMNEKGYEHLSLRKIAVECNVSHAAPYRHFSDKDALLSAMQKYVEERFAEKLKSSVVLDKNSDTPMIEFGKAYVVFFAEHPEYYRFLIAQDNIDIHISEKNMQTYSSYEPYNIFKEEAERHCELLHIPKEQYVTAITSMWATVHGLAGLATMSGVHFDGDWSEMTEKILRGVSPNE